MKKDDLTDILEEALSDSIARAAAVENELRRKISIVLQRELETRGWNLQEFADRSQISLKQAQKILHLQVGGKLHFSSLVRAANLLNLEVDINFLRR